MACNWSKLKKYRLLAKSERLLPHLPATRPFSREALDSFLTEYGRVVVKPAGGSGGKGVLFVSITKSGYRLRSGKTAKTVRSLERLYKLLRAKAKRRRHLVQRKIRLARVDGRPFDVRVMVQRKRKRRKWKITAKLVRIAGRGWLITNTARSGGRVTTFAGALRRSDIRGVLRKTVGGHDAGADGAGAGGLPDAGANGGTNGGGGLRRLERRIDRLCLRAARRLGRRCRSLRVVGFDIGLDREGHPWIIEANFRPSKKLFKRLKDKSLYRRIMRYTR